MMLNQIGLSILLAVSVLGNIAQVWHGLSRYDAGRADERASWVSVIAERNRQIEQLSAEATRRFDVAEHARATAIAEALGHALPGLPPEIIAACSLPEPVRGALNRIGGGS